jgi:quercetin dioxygenase-like cupin family protein
MDYASPNAQFTFDLKNDLFFKKDDRNYINRLSIKDLNTLGNYSLLDIFLTTGNVVEPHIHQNASELVYCISGSAGQVANIPQGWWHYEIAAEDNTHLLAIFDAPIPEAIFGSDILRLTPASVWAHSYCLDEAQVKATFAPIQETAYIGPPKNCKKGQQVAAHSARIGSQPAQHAQAAPPVQAGQPAQVYGYPAYYPQTYGQTYYGQQAGAPQGYGQQPYGGRA